MNRITTTIASSLLLCASFWASADAADTFTDLRVAYQLAIVDDFDDSDRLSVMIIGPLCSIFPVGCGTPSRVSGSPSSSDEFDSYDHVLLDGGSGTLDPLFSIEVVQASYSDDTNPAEVDTMGVNLGIALGWEIGCCSENRWQIETGLYFGFGLAEHDDGLGNDDENLLYYDYGLRLGTHYTWGFGLQLGFDARFEGMSFDDANIPAQVAPSSATTYALSVGYRF